MLVNINRLNLLTTMQSSILVNMKHPKLHTALNISTIKCARGNGRESTTEVEGAKLAQL